ncbi:MAG: hypothetical protein LBC96_01495 [Lachnospiraceae bacterium]|jgi:hypothetical protein|nr:hypothetical protein [Lachnospiraceae bacterium]
MIKIITIISVILLLSLSIVLFISTTPSTKPLYGSFTYINDDGSVVVVVLTESTIYIENLEYEEYKNLEKNAALSLTINYLNENNLPVELGEEFGRIQQDFMKNMDFSSLYNNKEIPITEVRYDEINNAYDYSIRNPKDGSPGIWLWVDINRKEMYLGSKILIYTR